MIGTNEIVLDDRTTFITYKDKHWVFTGYDFVQLGSPCCEEKSGMVLEAPALPDDMKYDWSEGHLKAVKRNKQVDVPTEAWQKDMERRLKAVEQYALQNEFETSCHTGYYEFLGVDANRYRIK